MTSSEDPKTFSVDLTNCDREPIHLLGTIQDFGFIVAISFDWLIQRVSSNVERFTGKSPDDLLGNPLGVLLNDAIIRMLRSRLHMLSSADASERIFGVHLLSADKTFDVSLHVSGQSIILEAEPSGESQSVSPGALVRSMSGRLQRTQSAQELFDESVRQLRGVTGFDRVMLYRFNEDGAGTVVSEALRNGLEAFKGLNYPATDIPVQARALYIRNRVRTIADVDATPVSIDPLHDPNSMPLDLSMSVLRSVSPIHIEYLKNMGVSASYSISVVIDGRLWGLFALHHYAPRRLSMEMRDATELFGLMISLMIEGRLASEQRKAEENARELHDRFVGKIMSLTPSVADLSDFANDLRDIIPADGFAVWANGSVKGYGKTPPVEDMPALARFLNRAAANRVYSSDELGAVYPPARAYEGHVAGILSIPISRSPRDYLMFFREEIVHTVTWAGNPQDKQAGNGADGLRLSPRKSFEAWKETVRGRSRSWTAAEKKASEALRVSILEVLVRFTEETSRQQVIAQQQQELLIAELNHRVRNILALIRALVTQSKATATSVDDFSRIVSGRIQALARAHNQITDEKYAPQSLSEIIQTEVEAYIGGKVERVELTGVNVLVSPQAFSILALVFHEMVTNSAKYGSLSDSTGRVLVGWTIDNQGFCVIRWREEGGPAVQRPSRRGFGSTIIERSIPHDLGGEAEVNYKLAGLEARFAIPPRAFEIGPEHRNGIGTQGDQTQAAARTGGQMPGTREWTLMTSDNGLLLDGMNVLLVEDNIIISMDAEQLLESHGAKTVAIAASVSEARRILNDDAIHVAMLDVNLGAETSFPLVQILVDRGIPFVFVTGYGEKIEFPEAAGPNVEAVKKPFSEEELIKALTRAIERKRNA
ncbi:HWE histidine kinase domain-containing protein [Fulvimarina sp. 2208YS6-2-32]|uniref:histidine kinase n=1 Tax=Fulvimarina uroteuthidis TaxID=3098149 RepID=A0ABU5I0T7_9HYPH|nr:HWE histidine kinase domain-containing protein [Fulvimarina sp. 2208YS6-2-32]MDY8108935.1 HWE histidine kinase domain-containing protein [Fulvimarina sp. 2208YS6-2-32]